MWAYFKAALCNFDRNPQIQKMKLDDARKYVAQNSSFIKMGSYFMKEMSPGFPSDVLRLLCLNSVINRGPWKQHVGCLQIEAAAAAAGSCCGQLH